MNRILAYRVVKEYKVYGWTGFYGIEYQGSRDYNWHRIGSYHRDIKEAEQSAKALAKIYGVLAYDIGGYEIK